ncbi:hypothetical protein BYT27DRAFT_6884225 [Phlegmacium glaucopus]|nr:hypothetical protein BYT27DRAFT_6884225 [Phlegmacium glaucopus]
MSTSSLPSYFTPLLNRIPSYATDNQNYGQHVTLADRLRPRSQGAFIKQSRGGKTFLRLSAQEDDISLPVYGSGSLVEGTVELTKTEGVTSVEVKIEGKLHIKEIAEGGNSTANLCLNTALLWIKDPNNLICPPSMHFSIPLPTTFTHAEKTYPLPPTFNVKLSGLPGFIATIDYSVTAIISKPNGVPPVNSKALGLHIGSVIVSTPFVYYPRSCPPQRIPSPLTPSRDGFEVTQGWKVFESVLHSKKSVRPDIVTKLYTPGLRVFCITQPIPFYLTLESSAVSLAAFLPLSPTANTSASRKVTRVRLMRQTTVDVKGTTILGVKTDIWRVDYIGEGTFTLVGNDDKRIAYSGEISIDPAVKTVGFKAAGLSVDDCILFTVSPLYPEKSPFQDLRQVVPAP